MRTMEELDMGNTSHDRSKCISDITSNLEINLKQC